jgi:hypothetical protein
MITSAVYNFSLIALMHELFGLSDIYRLQSPRGHRWKFSEQPFNASEESHCIVCALHLSKATLCLEQ